MTTSRILHVDIETYSAADIKTAGLYKYVENDSFEILLAAYAWDDGEVRTLDLTDPDDLITFEEEIAPALRDPAVIKCAHNAAFERTCFTKYLGQYMPPEEWADTMVLAMMHGLPASLDAVGQALQLPEDKQKLKEGKALIQYFCKPCKPTKTNGGRTRNMPEDAPDKWERFKIYCRGDVVTEQELYRRLHRFPITETENRIRCLDARINEAGILIDQDLARSAIALDAAFEELHMKEMQKLTGLENPNSVAQLKGWLEHHAGLEIASLNKKVMGDIKDQATDPVTKRVLELRQLLGKTSTAKYPAMLAASCKDGRVRGILQYYGAGRTGRWAGRMIQVQNLPQNHLDQIGTVRELVKSRDLTMLDMLYDNVPDVLSQLIRTALVAEKGNTFLVADYHAIEAVCIAYLSGEKWRLDVFEGDGKIYEASYAQAFKVSKESVKKGSPERQKGKIMELALGYGGGVNALVAFGADKMGLTEDEMAELVKRWRIASPQICKLWRDAEQAAKAAIQNPGKPMKMPCGCAYIGCTNQLLLRLPSGRHLSYWNARIKDGGIVFMAQNQTTKKWQETSTWGGKLVENIVQSYARDILGEAMLRLADAGYAIRFHVHDEIITERPEGSRWEDQAEIMGQPVSWAPELDRYLRADGYTTPFYMKD